MAVSELVDREGISAVERALSLPDNIPSQDPRLIYFLLYFSKRSPWEALAFYKAHQHQIDENCGTWAAYGLRPVVVAACNTSAGSLIETLEALRVGLGTPKNTVSFPEPGELIFPEDFDFPLAIDYLLRNSENFPRQAGEFLLKWADRSPADALNWLHAHPGFSSFPKRELTTDHNLDGSDLLLAMANSPNPDRGLALQRLSEYPTVERENAWKIIGRDQSRIDPILLNAAQAAGCEMVYLTSALTSATNRDLPDPSWAAVPAGLRSAATQRVLSAWTARDPSPGGEKARAHWLDGMATLDAK